MSTKFNNHPLINVEKLFLLDSSEILHLKQALETNGWCFVRLYENNHAFAAQLDHVKKSLLHFFTQNDNDKSLYLSSNAFGYSRINHKEGIKLLTNSNTFMDEQISSLPMTIKAVLQHLSQLIGSLTFRLKPIINQLCMSDTQESTPIQLSASAMLDIVHYFNRKNVGANAIEVGYNTDEVNCVPHYDPGLFSLSILSTCDGLQLKDRLNDTWINGPNNSQHDQENIGVIWLGEAAAIITGHRLKPGIHRVIYSQIPHQARLTVWQEICTEEQIRQLLEHNGHELLLPAGAKVILANQPDSMPMFVLPRGETSYSFMKRVESTRGLSMSKSLPHDIRIFPNGGSINNVTHPPSTNNKASSKHTKKMVH